MTPGAVVYLIDDDEAVRDALSISLLTAGLVVQSFPAATAFLDALTHLAPGCIVTDIRMPEIDGLTLQRRLAAQGNTWPVIIMTGHGDIAMAVQAMKAGAIDFLEKPFSDEALIKAVSDAADRHGRQTMQTAATRETRSMMAALTPRERQVLDGLVAGLPNKTIGYDLGISPRTVEIYRANVMSKMGAASLSELVRRVCAVSPIP